MKRLPLTVRRLMVLVAIVAVLLTWYRWQISSPPPARRIVAAVFAARAARPVTPSTSSEDLAIPAMVVLGVLAASRWRRLLLAATA